MGSNLDLVILDAIPSPVIVIDRFGKLLRFNRASEQLTGYARDEVLGQPLWRLLAREKVVAYEAWIAKGLEQQRVPPMEGDLLGREGERRRVTWSLSVCQTDEPDKPCVVLTVAEVVRGPDELLHQETQEALRQSEERFSACFTQAAVAMALADMQGRFVQVNPAFCALTGYTPTELCGRHFTSITHPLDIESNLHVRDRLAAGQIPRAIFEKRYIHKTGKVIWIQASASVTRDSQGNPVGVVAMMQDISERRRAEQELRALNETLEKQVAERTEVARSRAEELARSESASHRQRRILELVLDNMGDGVAVVDESGHFRLFTPAAERILGRPPSDLPFEQWPSYFGFHLPDQVSPYPSHQLPLRRALRGESVNDAEIFVRNTFQPHGTWISTTSRPIFDEAGLQRGAVTVIHDLSERKRNEALLQESERHFQELAEHNRRLARELEHRVRNNLAALLGLVALMRNRAGDVPSFADAIEGRLSAMAHVDHLLSRSGWQAVDLGSLVASSLATVQYMAPHAIPEQVQGPELQIPPRCALPLTLILLEWFVNSCKHGAHRSAQGRLTVTWDLLEDARVRLTWTESGGAPIGQPVVPSLGIELVRAFATRELRGRCELNFPPQGVCHVLEFSAKAGPP